MRVADADDVRALALALPHVVEIDSDGFDFRVGDKGFVWSYPQPGRPRVIRTDIAVLYVGDQVHSSIARAQNESASSGSLSTSLFPPVPVCVVEQATRESTTRAAPSTFRMCRF